MGVTLHERRGTLTVAGGQRVMNCLRDRVAPLEPPSRSPVELGDHTRLVRMEAMPQHFREEMMVAKPLTVVVQGRDERVPVLQAFEHPLTFRRARAVLIIAGA